MYFGRQCTRNPSEYAHTHTAANYTKHKASHKASTRQAQKQHEARQGKARQGKAKSSQHPHSTDRDTSSHEAGSKKTYNGDPVSIDVDGVHLLADAAQCGLHAQLGEIGPHKSVRVLGDLRFSRCEEAGRGGGGNDINSVN